ncbi:MAG: DEAD/DEAH box helicase [Bacteroidales bacterium]|nr:DEAD/DEAH box helicase [Bacteroidales bacterium]
MEQYELLSLIHPGLQKLIQEKGWKDGFTDIQKESIPVILSNDNCIIEAPTAGGKTEAVFFPCLTKAAKDKSNSVQVLYIAPLKALLNDIEIRVNEYSNACGLHCFKWHGDVSQSEKIDAITNSPDVLLTTPESLEAILLRKPNWPDFFKKLQVIIIDEAHNFASVDRGCHLITLLERLCFKIETSPQRIAITATVGNPDEMLKWLTGSSKNIGKRVFVTSDQKKEKDFQIHFFYDSKPDEDTKTPSQFKRLSYLYNLLPLKKSIVFGGSRTNCENVASAINKLNSNIKRRIPIKVRTHHSSVSKYYREEAERRIKIKNDFESGIDCIISTSTLELGIDIGQLDQVFQLDAISSSSAFLQRVGRTGRRMNKAQFFRGLLLDEDDLILLTGVVNLGIKGISEHLFFPKKAFNILAHQLICLSLQNNGINSSKAWKILSNAYCFSQISENQFNEMISYMINSQYLRDVDGELVIGELTEKEFLGANWQKLFAVFSGGPLYEVFNEKNHVGNLDCAFVESMEVPFHFVLGGLEWEAFNVKPESHLVLAKKTKVGNAPRWNAFHGSDVPFESAKEVGKIIFSNTTPSFLKNEAIICFQSEQLKFINQKWNEYLWVFMNGFNESELLTFAGDRINRTLAKLINVFNIGLATSNYKSVIIKTNKSDLEFNVIYLFDLLRNLKNETKNISNSYMIKLNENTSPKFFSKFGKLLPSNLISATIAERSYDFDGLISELNKIKILSQDEIVKI